MLMPSIFDEDVFDDLFNVFPFYNDKDERKLEKKLYGRRGRNLMKTDIRETNQAYEMEIDLPGFKKEDVKVSLENGYLTISAEKGMEDEDTEKKHGRYIRRERYAGTCERAFYVGDDVRQEDIKGEFKHGILKLTIPNKDAKPEVETKKYIAIEG